MFENVVNFDIRNLTIMAVSFHFEKSVVLKNRTKLKNAIKQIFKVEQRALASLDVIFCSDAYLLQINQTYLQHNYFTDIITFDLSESMDADIMGEIYISVDTVKSNASRFKVDLNHELHRVIFHGVLHLCSFNDKSPAQSRAMGKAEDKYLELYFSSKTSD